MLPAGTLSCAVRVGVYAMRVYTHAVAPACTKACAAASCSAAAKGVWPELLARWGSAPAVTIACMTST
jgi:hypothetical protein